MYDNNNCSFFLQQDFGIRRRSAARGTPALQKSSTCVLIWKPNRVPALNLSVMWECFHSNSKVIFLKMNGHLLSLWKHSQTTGRVKATSVVRLPCHNTRRATVTHTSCYSLRGAAGTSSFWPLIKQQNTCCQIRTKNSYWKLLMLRLHDRTEAQRRELYE